MPFPKITSLVNVLSLVLFLLISSMVPIETFFNFDLRININGLFEFVVKQKEFDM